MKHVQINCLYSYIGKNKVKVVLEPGIHPLSAADAKVAIERGAGVEVDAPEAPKKTQRKAAPKTPAQDKITNDGVSPNKSAEENEADRIASLPESDAIDGIAKVENELVLVAITESESASDELKNAAQKRLDEVSPQ